MDGAFPDAPEGSGALEKDSSRPAASSEGPAVGASVQLRKPHPCGGLTWTVTRVGADIGLQCGTCARRILLPRGEFNRRLRAYL